MMIRKILATALLVAGMPCAASAATPSIVIAPPQLPRQLSVNATASESASPDMATIGFTIETHDQRSAAMATSDNNAIYQRFLAQAVASGLSAKNIRTTYFNIAYTAPPPRGGPIMDYGYSVTRAISVEVHKLDRVGATIDTAVAAGINNVNSVSFGLSDNHPLLLRALADAVAQARASAQAIAKAAGVRLLGVHSISENFTSMPTAQPMGRAMVAGTFNSVPTTIEPTSVSVQATVSISYDIR